MATDPYTVLGVRRNASDDEVRTAYRRLVKATHPDHNNGSPEAAKRFEAVQEAYADIQRMRRSGAAGPRTASSRTGERRRTTSPPPPPEAADPAVEARLADLERQVRQAAKKAERAARRAAARASAASAGAGADGEDAQRRPTDEELGYYTTDDSVWKILTDARTELTERYADARAHPADHPVAKRVSDLIEGLESLTDKLDRKPPR